MTANAVSDARPRLDFLHGVRGLAALTVVLFHVTLNAAPDRAGPIVRLLNVPLLHGYLAVSVFLVLSGFLLAMPVVTNGLMLRGGIRGFMWRRSMRILPPYYAAYLLDMLFFAGANWLATLLGRDPGGTVHHQIATGYRWPTVVAHLLLVHNMSREWVDGMDAILWSIGCEWQIYLLFAIALVPLWRRGGLWMMLAVCAVLAAAITEAFARNWCVYVLPWMIPIFGIGAAGASVAFGTTQRAAAMQRWPWGAITLASLAMMFAGICLLDAGVAPETMRGPVQYYDVSLRIRWIYDVLAAVAMASFIVWLTLDCRHGNAPEGMASRLRTMLESRWLQGLGRFSYSLYLTHGIVLVFMARATACLWPHRLVHWAVMMIGGALASLAFGYMFHLCVERRFMTGEMRGMFSPREASPSGVASCSSHASAISWVRSRPHSRRTAERSQAETTASAPAARTVSDG
jgi:peptidoglycan/LPS O-acetylase OafA/YrhL